MRGVFFFGLILAGTGGCGTDNGTGGDGGDGGDTGGSLGCEPFLSGCACGVSITDDLAQCDDGFIPAGLCCENTAVCTCLPMTCRNKSDQALPAHAGSVRV